MCRYDAADQGEKAADKTADWFAKQKGKAASNTHSQADEAADEAGGAVRSAADSVADGAQYVKDRYALMPQDALSLSRASRWYTRRTRPGCRAGWLAT